MISQRLKLNILILFIGLGLAFLGVYIARNPDFLQASVLNLQEKEIITQQRRDIAYKTTGNVLDIFGTTGIAHADTIHITVEYSPDITISTGAQEFQGAYSLSVDTGVLVIDIIPLTGVDWSKSLIVLPFSGQENTIVLSEASIIQGDKQTPLAIGKLVPSLTHSTTY